MSCSAILSMCVLTALAYFLFTTSSCRMHCQRATARPVWVILTAGGIHGHPLQLGRCTESLRLTMVRAMRLYTHVPRFFADPPTHSATIRRGLPRTGGRRLLCVRRVRQKVLASAGGFWLGHIWMWGMFKLETICQTHRVTYEWYLNEACQRVT